MTSPRRSILTLAYSLPRRWDRWPSRKMCGASPSARSPGDRQRWRKDRTRLPADRLAMQAKDFARAHDEFRVAVTFLPDALTTANQHDAALKGFCESGVKLAEQRIAEGKYGEAEQIVQGSGERSATIQIVARRSSSSPIWPSPVISTRRWARSSSPRSKT